MCGVDAEKFFNEIRVNIVFIYLNNYKRVYNVHRMKAKAEYTRQHLFT